MVYILLGEGFEEAEALVTCDILRRGGLSVSLVSVTDETAVTGAHGITVIADAKAPGLVPNKDDALFIPGGMGGVNSIRGSRAASELILTGARAGAFLAAICAGPAVFAALGLLNGKRITCYPGCEGMMTGASCDTGKSLVSDGRLLTGRAPGSAFDFGLALLSRLTDSRNAESVRRDLVY